MRILLILVIAVGAIWAGAWWVITRDADAATEALVAEMRDAGWEVRWDELRTRGFPSRIDTTATGLEIASPGGGFAYATERLQELRLLYRRERAIFAAAPGNRLDVGRRSFDIEAEALRASADLLAGEVLDRVTLEAEALRTEGLAAEGILAAMRPAAGVEHGYELYLSVEQLALGGAAPGPLTVDALVAFSGPLDRAALTAPPRLERLQVRSLTYLPPEGDVRVSGIYERDADGRLAGELGLEGEGLARVPDLLDALLPELAAEVNAALPGEAVTVPLGAAAQRQ
ncbi:hypothetical protein OG2516_14141 [Oceanicola granulosus HTCC2516]|uniref:DUF2125 domain-containing protein n=1 Tax=Oceanicola granulosus (strain ATCC BAA-861 / DSM 15982 / KCTC 12143 / HTCC2516) TaxID=314256 RepID=Q2CB49_OCEGH|nr:DUF2125 domain-containing protein [Oceanicola granulosus]EAR49881.1 hypothetical protein OG2516_14141 [Oceanicola granulosus HTCC2516]